MRSFSIGFLLYLLFSAPQLVYGAEEILDLSKTTTASIYITLPHTSSNPNSHQVQLWSKEISSTKKTRSSHKDLNCELKKYRQAPQKNWKTLSPNTALSRFASYLCHQKHSLWQSPYSIKQLNPKNKPVWIRGKHLWHLASSR